MYEWLVGMEEVLAEEGTEEEYDPFSARMLSHAGEWPPTVITLGVRGSRLRALLESVNDFDYYCTDGQAMPFLTHRAA
jgi:hypothetical protein